MNQCVSCSARIVTNELDATLAGLNNQLEELDVNEQNEPMPVSWAKGLREGHSLACMRTHSRRADPEKGLEQVLKHEQEGQPWEVLERQQPGQGSGEQMR